MNHVLKLLAAAFVALTLSACATTGSAPEEGTSVIKTVTRPDGSVEKVENLTDYAAYARQASSEAKPLFEMSCPETGCIIKSLKVNAPSDNKTAIAAPPKTVGMAITEGFFSLGRDAIAIGVPWAMGAKVLNKAFDKANSWTDNSNHSVTNTDTSNRSVDNSNRSVTTNTDNSNRSTNNSNNRNCQTGAPVGTTGQTGSSGPASC